MSQESMLVEDLARTRVEQSDYRLPEDSLESSLPRLENLLTQYSKQLAATERRTKLERVPKRGLSRITLGLISTGVLLFTLAVVLGGMYAWSATRFSATLMVPSLLIVLGGIHSSFDRRRISSVQGPNDGFASELEQLNRAGDLLSVLSDLSHAISETRRQSERESGRLVSLQAEVASIEQSKNALIDELAVSRDSLDSLQEELELRRCSVESAKFEWNELSSKQAGLQRDMEATQRALESIHLEAANARLDLERLVSEVRVESDRCEGLQAESTVLEEGIELKRMQLAELEGSERELQGLIQSLRALAELERHQSESRIEEMSRLESHLVEKHKQLSDEVDAIGRNRDEEEMLAGALLAQRTTLQAEVVLLENQISQLVTTKESVQRDLGALQDQFLAEECNQTIRDRGHLLALTISLITAEQSNAESVHLRELSELVQSLEATKWELESHIENLKEGVDCVSNEKRFLEEEKDRLLDSLFACREQKEEIDREIERRLEELDSCDSQVRAAIEYRFALDLQNESLQAQLAQRKVDSDALQASNEALLRLAADYQGVVDDLDSQQRLISGEYQKVSNEILEKRTILEALETSVQTAHQLLKELTDQSVSLSESIDSQSQLCLEKTEQAERLLDHLEDLANRKNDLESLLMELEADCEVSRNELSEIQNQKDQCTSALEHTRETLAQYEERVKSLDLERSQIEAALRELDSRRSSLEQEQSQLESEVLDLNRRIDLANERIPQLDLTIRSLELDREQLRVDISEGRSEVDSVRALNREEQKQLDLLRGDVQLESKRLTELRYECDEILERQGSLREELIALESSIERKASEANACQIEIERLSEERLALKREQIVLTESVESLERQKRELARVETELSQQTRMLIELQDKAANEEQKLTMIEASKRSVESQWQLAQGDLKSVEIELDQANKRLEKATRDLHQAELIIQTKRGDVIMVEKKLMELEQSKTTLDLEVARMMEEATEASKVCGQWRAYKETLSRELDQLAQEKQSMSNEVVGLEFRRKELQSAIRDLETTKTSLAATAKAAQEEVNKETKKAAEQRLALKDLMNEIEKARCTLGLLEDEQRDRKLVVESLEREASQFEKSVLESRRELVANQQEASLMHQRLEMSRSEIQGEEARIREIQKEFAIAEDNLHKSLVKVDVLRLEIERLDQKKSEWEAGEESRTQLLQQHALIEQRHLEYVEEIKVLEQQRLSLEAGLLQREGELSRLKQSVSAAEEERESQRRDLASIQLSLSEMEERKKVLVEDLIKLNLEQVEKKEALERLSATRLEQERSSSDLADRILRLTEDIGHLSRQRMGLENEIQDKQSQIESLVNDCLVRERQLLDEETKLVHVRTEVESLEEKLLESKLQVEAIQKVADLERVDLILQVGLRETMERANTFSIAEETEAPGLPVELPTEEIAIKEAQILEAVQDIQSLAEEAKVEVSALEAKQIPSLWDSILG